MNLIILWQVLVESTGYKVSHRCVHVSYIWAWFNYHSAVAPIQPKLTC